MDMSETAKALKNSPVINSEEARLAQEAADRSADLPPDQINIDSMKITQHWDKYTDENHEVWGILYEKRMDHLASAGSNVFLKGAEVINLNRKQVPDLRDVNANLLPKTGWSSHGVPGYLPAKSFFAFLAQRQFPTTITVRPKTSMDYLPEPDIIHDVFGHVPIPSSRTSSRPTARPRFTPTTRNTPRAWHACSGSPLSSGSFTKTVAPSSTARG